jgi:hypothetical protein
MRQRHVQAAKNQGPSVWLAAVSGLITEILALADTMAQALVPR